MNAVPLMQYHCTILEAPCSRKGRRNSLASLGYMSRECKRLGMYVRKRTFIYSLKNEQVTAKWVSCVRYMGQLSHAYAAISCAYASISGPGPSNC